MPDEQGKLTVDERTTPLGLYHYGVSYEAAARLLNKELDRDAATHPSAPTVHLLTHAIELYLKAFLRLKGATLGELKSKFSHDIPKLGVAFTESGGTVTDHDRAVFSHLTQTNIFAQRYIVVGAYVDVGFENLAKTAANLHGAVRDAIRVTGEWCHD